MSEENYIYRYDKKGRAKSVVVCPRCKSYDCGFYQQYVPEKTKTKYSVNLNPLKPFTLVNKKEKVKQQAHTEEMYICNKCGKIFE